MYGLGERAKVAEVMAEAQRMAAFLDKRFGVAFYNGDGSVDDISFYRDEASAVSIAASAEALYGKDRAAVVRFI